MDFLGKICPYCKTEFTEDDEVVVCSICEMPHHKDCWIENKACTTFGCTGTILGANQLQSNGETVRFCIKCGTPYTEGKKFCRACGAPTSGMDDTSVNYGGGYSQAQPRYQQPRYQAQPRYRQPQYQQPQYQQPQYQQPQYQQPQYQQPQYQQPRYQQPQYQQPRYQQPQYQQPQYQQPLYQQPQQVQQTEEKDK